MRVAVLTEELRAEQGRLQVAVTDATRRLHEVEQRVVQTEETVLLQEVGVYDYQHPLSDVVAYKERLAEVKARIKAMSRDGKAVLGSTNWQVNGSAAEGRRMVRDFSKLMLRAYNAEADNCVRTLRPYKLQSAVDRLEKAVEMIVKLGKTMSIQRRRVRQGRRQDRHDPALGAGGPGAGAGGCLGAVQVRHARTDLQRRRGRAGGAAARRVERSAGQ